MPQRGGASRQHAVWKNWDGCLISWIHVHGCCLNQPKVTQFQFYADFSHFMLVTCAAPATWHQHFTSLPKLPWEKKNCRTWKKDEPFDYCAAKTACDENGISHITHKGYLGKVSPLPLAQIRHLHPPMSDNELTMLRQLLASNSVVCCVNVNACASLNLASKWVKSARVFPFLWLRWTNVCDLPRATLVCISVFVHFVVWTIYVCLMRCWECNMARSFVRSPVRVASILQGLGGFMGHMLLQNCTYTCSKNCHSGRIRAAVPHDIRK